MDTATPIGLYSISVRDLDVPELLRLAVANGVPFVHLRGGPRGFDLAAQRVATVWQWRKMAEDTVPITGVTADLDLADLLEGDSSDRTQAAYDLAQLTEAAALLGAGWVRLLARTPLDERVLADAGTLPVLARSAVPLLVELHHPAWVEEGAFGPLIAMVESCSSVRLLADTAQLAAALPDDGGTPAWAGQVLDHAAVVHLSDTGTGLHAPGHALVAALAADRIDAGQCLEVALEWTGPDRNPAECVARYRAATTWWADLTARETR
ncbi:sugar phosphate isomerase/epimerase family protein [Streptosporangium lutulentum]|uniref:Sugar phosphate isomerase/epimerase n=1 Tax=Streptosporangium lutulentum TaxID=1461250 RepID=A0ABT9Q686_9ACTN|nr:hypothetical protein [Streptosporangium lutulentum]MDP9842217.1 hypothetical protein [Streptosporangium lutulentum]